MTFDEVVKKPYKALGLSFRSRIKYGVNSARNPVSLNGYKFPGLRFVPE